MFKIGAIIRANNATFYDYNTGKRQSRILRNIALIASSVLIGIFFHEISDDMLAGVVAVQSIMLGFAFNVMFFLIGNIEKSPSSKMSIEQDLRDEKLEKLHNELFYNVTYFNLIAISLIVIAIMLLLPLPTATSIGQIDLYIHHYVDRNNFNNVVSISRSLVYFVCVVVFYALLIESILSVGRIVGRTTFYFEKRLAKTQGID